ncbi:MAG: hypothetical protein ACKOUK_08740, partial [Verrucomicrobiota bacterium]
GVMFSHGLCMSVSHALVDGPALLLAALGVRALAHGRPVLGGTALALGGLAKETGLLAASGLTFSPRAPRTWLPAAGQAVLVLLPLLLWMAYVRLRFGPAEDPGLGNFTLPLAGLAEKFGAIARDLRGPEPAPLAWTTLAAVLGLVVQAGFFLLRWRPEDRWWRVGATFAGLLLFLSTPVWEGYPGAATRALLADVRPGMSTFEMRGGGPGVVLAELYDAAAGRGGRLVNLSARARTEEGEHGLIVGFAVGSGLPRRLLLRVLGPELAAYGVEDVLADPRLEVFTGEGERVAANDDWEPALAAVMERAGAPALALGSRDAALVLTVAPGRRYTVAVRGAEGVAGEVVVELYELP